MQQFSKNRCATCGRHGHWAEQSSTSPARLAVPGATNVLPTVGLSAQKTCTLPHDEGERDLEPNKEDVVLGQRDVFPHDALQGGNVWFRGASVVDQNGKQRYSGY